MILPWSNMQSSEYSDMRRQILSQDRPWQPRMWIVNTNPNEVSKSPNAKLIRSHAAKEGHYRQRERRRGHLEVRQYQPTVPSKKRKRHTSEGETGTKTQIRPQTISNPEPQSSLSRYRRDPFQGHARTTSHTENELIDHYTRCVVDNGYVNCGACSSHGEPFRQPVNSCWVPWSLEDDGLLAGLLMTACRSLVSFQTQNEFHATLLLRYKNECVQMIRAAISNTEISDQTIVLALVLAAEELMAGNYTEYCLHGTEIMKMINIRGAINNLGNGFLGHLLYNPALKMVLGQDPPPLKRYDRRMNCF
ncbi:hypothetical protein H0G86_010643 [Trichoderma simmonsii]|uniref:Uncharacterized protein n=1 Tax=Trichoderma simmonsii TaxID=1491479 RepID=A0A8G0PJI7_9HYPO|nr:hypothetical protein H0G86_010643 [Trichoderma simmonsii]